MNLKNIFERTIKTWVFIVYSTHARGRFAGLTRTLVIGYFLLLIELSLIDIPPRFVEYVKST